MKILYKPVNICHHFKPETHVAYFYFSPDVVDLLYYKYKYTQILTLLQIQIRTNTHTHTHTHAHTQSARADRVAIKLFTSCLLKIKPLKL